MIVRLADFECILDSSLHGHIPRCISIDTYLGSLSGKPSSCTDLALDDCPVPTGREMDIAVSMMLASG